MLRLYLSKPESIVFNVISDEIYQLIKQGEHVLLLVPDQFTLQAERNILQYLNLKGFIDLEVLSFNRLGWRLMESVKNKHLSEQGKSMILRMIIDECSDCLTVFRSVCRYKGFVQECSAAVEKLSAALITPDMLNECSKSVKGIARFKLKDISYIYSLYTSIISDKYLDTNSFLNELAGIIGKSRL
ncbi:MAG TPA: hypothetical protein PLZ84_05030, partial [Clostridia bacterium]|nr:hypothetical protein [Clostridia bacterium]